jgi:ATP-dependent DNA ligase
MTLAQGQGRTLGGATIYPRDSIADEELAALVAQYKRVIASRYRAVTVEDAGSLPPGPLHVSPKIDGELWYMVRTEDETALVAHNGRVILGDLPVLTEALGTFGARAEAGTVVAGELFATSTSGRPRVGDVASALGSSGDPGRIGFQAFDLVCGSDRQAAPDDYATRIALVASLFAGGTRAVAVKTDVVAGHEGIRNRLAMWVESGKAEGLVARTRDGRIYKIKPVFSIDCLVLGYTERTDDPEQVRSLLLGLYRDDDTVQVVGQVGNLGTDDDRRAMLTRLQDTVIESRYRSVARSGAMYRLVRPEMVVEIRCTDVQPDVRGEHIRQWTIRLDDADGWVPVAPVQGAALIHPVLARVRDDKSPNETDVRIKQLLERCLVADLDTALAAPDLPPSKILRREVYTKVTKGVTAVRKIIVWQTHKSEHDPAFPAFVVHFTDYSPGRKTPLARTVRLAPTQVQAQVIAEEILEAKIKRGWNQQQRSP